MATKYYVKTFQTSEKANLTTDVSDVLPVANGGTGQSTFGTGGAGIVVANGTSNLALIQHSVTNGQVLTIVGGSPTWANATGSTYNQEIFVISATDVTNKYITLTNQPLSVTNVKVTIVGGSIQLNHDCLGSTGLTGDFNVNPTLSTKRVYFQSHDAITLSGDIMQGNTIIVEYFS